MAFTQYTNLDFDQIKESIKDYLRANSNFTDFDFEGSNLSVLVDALAYNSYITAYNTNAVVNEVFIDSAVLRQNVVSLARNIGYIPRSKRAASATVSFLAEVPANNTTPTVTLKAGIVATGGASDLSYTFSIPQDISVPVTEYDGVNPRYAAFNEVEIYEGSFVKNNFTVDTSIPDQKFVLPNSDIDTSTLVVKVRDTENDTIATTYNKVDTIVGVSTNVYAYFLQEVAGEKYELVFGDDIILNKLENGNFIDCSYIVTNGKEANGSAAFSFSGIVQDSLGTVLPQDTALDLNIDSSARNGDDIESVNSIKYYAPRLYSSQYRAVSANDYESIIPHIYENTESVTAYGGEELDPPQYGKVFIVIKPRNGEIISDYTKRELLLQLKKYSVAGIVPEFVDLKYLYVELDSAIYYNPNFTGSASEILSEVTTGLDTYSKSLSSNKFGGRVKYSKVVSIIDNIHEAITSNITKVKIRRNLRAEIGRNAQYELCYGNKFHSRSEGYSIKSSGFTVFGISDTVYLADRKINDKIGSIFFFTLDQSGNPNIINRNAGTVYYEKGEIIIDTVNITSTVVSDNVIEIQAIPDSNDVIGLKDLYVQLSISSSKLTMVSDLISSGDNVAGTRFTSTSSFINGLYTR
tara:strand:- start:2127 stop:4031 length:1905 start_codon:yes stop_codon:yes gene_type:complete